MERVITINRTLRGEDDIRAFVSECEQSLEKQMDDAAAYFLASEGNHYVALSGCARKLCGVILAVLREKRPYEPRPSIQSTQMASEQA